MNQIVIAARFLESKSKMYPVSLSVFIFWLASAAAYNPFSAATNQRPFSHHTDVSELPTIIPLPGSMIRCGNLQHMECIYYWKTGVVWCRCVSEMFENKSPGKKESASSIEVFSEIQPGNNETLVSLFEMVCEEKSAVGCASWNGGEYVCGCHQYECDSSEDLGDCFADWNGDQEKKTDEGKDDTVPELGDLRLTKGGEFRFKRFKFPHCKPGFHIKCCSYRGKSRCFCAGDEAHCPH